MRSNVVRSGLRWDGRWVRVGAAPDDQLHHRPIPLRRLRAPWRTYSCRRHKLQWITATHAIKRVGYLLFGGDRSTDQAIKQAVQEVDQGKAECAGLRIGF